MSYEQFRDQVVFISGAAGGFGTLLSDKLAAAGARLILTDRNAETLELLAGRLKAAGADLIAQPADITQESEVESVLKNGIERFGRLDIAINNAGLATPMKSFVDTEEAEMDLHFAVNTKGVFFGMKHQLRQMLTQDRGCILNIASMAGIGAGPKLASYTAAKHAVVGLTRTAAVEYAAKNIRVNAICPFYSPTAMVTDSMGDDLQAFLANGSPMKRLGKPEEMVAAMLSVCSPDNGYLTGQAIPVDGGLSAF
ncbi:SDR family NAD(P)-dependent oxidoreductase [Vibrio sp.]|uniref:SDR family NAD(P)-dependent oxidoreductase n=1 Tax=Vibrio sp. TaxID=678 RepID=UPI003D131F67